MVSLIGQVLLAIGMAVTMFAVLPFEVYVLVGVLAAILSAGMMISVEAEHLEITAGYLLTVSAIGALFGVLWPALPIIVVWGGVKRRRAESQKAREKKDSAGGSSNPPAP